jgi:membrane associated rhomboid family serine protease
MIKPRVDSNGNDAKSQPPAQPLINECPHILCHKNIPTCWLAAAWQWLQWPAISPELPFEPKPTSMIFPIGDDNRDRKSVPVVNIAIIVLNFLVFVVFQQFGANDAFTMSFSTVPEEIVTGHDIVTQAEVKVVRNENGEPQQVLVPGLGRTPIPVYLTILTSMFMHGGIAHILGNMWFLWIFGDNIEDDMGRGRYLLFYLLCGILASLAHVFASAGGPQAEVPSLGASGAISGVMGAYLVLHPLRQVTVIMIRIVMNVPAYVAVGLWFLFQLASGFFASPGTATGGVAYMAHIGGFVAGAALARPFIAGRSFQPQERSYTNDRNW